MSKYAIGIDLGATKLASAMIDQNGQVIAHYKSKTPSTSETLMNEIGTHVQRLAQGVEDQIQGVGIGSPGWHNQKLGVVEGAVNLGDQTFNLRNGLKEQFDYPMAHATDAHAEALGEWLFGAGQGSQNMVYFGIGSGLGSGLIIDGKLYQGTNGVGGNMAHFAYGFDGDVCECGLVGCLENHVGGLAIPHLKQIIKVSGNFPESTLTEINSNQELLQAALNGSPFEKAVFEEMGRWLGVALSVSIAIVNPDRVVIGGGIGRAAFDLLYPTMIAEAKKRTISIAWRELTVKKSMISNSAVGAACLVWQL